MRGWPVVGLFLGVLALPAASSAPAPFTFADEPGDVTRDAQPYDGQYSDTVDVVSAGVSEEDGLLRFRLELADLAEYEPPPLDQTFATQYVLTFYPADAEDGYSMRAIYGGLLYGTDPRGAWRFEFHEHAADVWSTVEGRVDGDTLRWEGPLEDLPFGVGDVLERWNAQVWWTKFGSDTQIHDIAVAESAYVVGEGVLSLAQEPEVLPVCAAPHAAVVVTDVERDVTQGQDPYDGPGAATTDILYGCVAGEGTDLLFELALSDLAGIEKEAQHEGFHAQYAFTFRTEGAGIYSMRATARGEGMRGPWDPLWSFSVHDQTTDEWPDASGTVAGNTLRWRVPAHQVGATGPAALTEWQVQTWNSYEHKEQYGDWAKQHAEFRFRPAAEGVTVTDPPCAFDGSNCQSQGAPGLSAALAALAAIGAVVSRRMRRP